MPDIDDKWLDVDFETDPNYTFGALAEPMFGDASTFEEEFGVMSDAEIEQAMAAMDAEGGGADQLVTRIYDQKSEGSCVANAICQVLEILQALQFGKDKVTHLAAMSVYRHIGRSPSSGAMVSDGVKQVQNVGAVPLDTPDNRAKFGDKVMANTGWSQKFPDGWRDVAKLFRGVEMYTIRSVAGIFTAGCLQHPVIVGRQGHSICYCRPMRRNGRRVFRYANSWKASWGDGGFGYDSESQIKQSANYAFALRSTVIPE